MALVVSARPVSAAPTGVDPTTLHFVRLDRTYPNVAPEFARVRQGPLTISLASPQNVVVLRHHRVELEPLGDGMHRARLELEVLGGGRLHGDLELGGLRQRLDDRVVVPPQTIVIEGTIRVQSRPDGLAVTVVALPPAFRVAIQSQLGNRVVGLCESFTFLLSRACSGLDQALTSVDVPLPPPESTYLLPADSVTEAERQAVERYLGATAQRKPGRDN